MFTGIVQQMGRVIDVKPAACGATLRIDPGDWAYSPVPGDSIAVNGCCLTSASTGGERLLDFDVIHQTLRLTTLGSLSPGDRVNLEHAATPQTLLGGHLVQGHVDGVGVVLAGSRASESAMSVDEVRLAIEAPPGLMEFIMPQGSIAVDGVSLTVAACAESWFEVALIPTTLERTTLGAAGQGACVNLETDCIAKMVLRQLARFQENQKGQSV